MKVHYDPSIEHGIQLWAIAPCGAGKGVSQYGIECTARIEWVTCARCLKRIGAPTERDTLEDAQTAYTASNALGLA